MSTTAFTADLGGKAILGVIAYAVAMGALLFALTHFGPWVGSSGIVLAGGGLAMGLATWGLYAAPRTRGLVVPFALASVFVLVRAWSFAPAGPVLFMDSLGYLEPPGRSWYQRPFAVPLINTLLHKGYQKIVFFQYLLALGTWLTLALAVYRLVRPGLERIVVPGLLLGLGLSHMVIRWDAFILSESYAQSFLILIFALVLFLHGRVRRTPAMGPRSYAGLGVLGILTFITLNTRDSLVYMLPVAAVFIVLYAWKFQLPRLFTAIALVLVLGLAGLQMRLAHDSLRWSYVMANVIFNRVLPDPERTAFFVERGMPHDAKVKAYQGHNFWRTDYQNHAAFTTWLTTRGKSVYTGYLLQRFPEVNGEMLQEMPEFFTLSDFKRKWLHDEPGQLFSPVTHMLDRVFFFRLPSTWFAPACALLAVVLALLPGTRALAALTLFLGASAYALVFIGYHADSVDEGRHTLLGQLLFRLSLLSGALTIWYQLRAIAMTEMPKGRGKWLSSLRSGTSRSNNLS